MAAVGTLSDRPLPRYGGVYRRALRGEPITLDPAFASSTYERLVIEQIYDGLIQFDVHLNIKPGLAEFWKASQDNLVWTFYLRKGVKFHNGREVVADDFVYSFTRIMSPKASSKLKLTFARVKGVNDFVKGKTQRIEGFRALDDYTLEIVFSQPYAPFIYMLPMLKVVPKEEVEHRGEAFGQSPVGTGAFRLISWDPGKAITLDANETYFEQRPYLDRVVYRIFPGGDREAIFAEFEQGHLEDSTIPIAKRDQLLSDPRYKKSHQSLFTTAFLWMNTREEPLNDPKVRRAINFAIDRSHLIRDTDKGRFTQARGIVPLGMFAYTGFSWVHI